VLTTLECINCSVAKPSCTAPSSLHMTKKTLFDRCSFASYHLLGHEAKSLWIHGQGDGRAFVPCEDPCNGLLKHFAPCLHNIESTIQNAIKQLQNDKEQGLVVCNEICMLCACSHQEATQTMQNFQLSAFHLQGPSNLQDWSLAHKPRCGHVNYQA